MAKREKELEFDWVEKFVHEGRHKVPNYNKYVSHIPMNAAAIIREEVLVQKQIDEEKRIMKELEVNMRDSSEFKKWQTRERKKDEINRLTHIHKKKVEMELARENGIKAVEEEWRKKRQNVIKLKKESEQKLNQREKKEEKILKKKTN